MKISKLRDNTCLICEFKSRKNKDTLENNGWINFMNEDFDLGYTTNLQFKNKKFVVIKEETDSVYLTEKEIMHLYRFDFYKMTDHMCHLTQLKTFPE